ncbi:MAG: apolipoprotein N-acyltransferase [Candidatus Aminicenantes bacterium RBG_19FT_COMBO_65_30]|nr:MAG: apolipoprotein N-acyltransferase [Candidatus Aminicenantes bacterium RBG_19FT_COMBO_65_30]
MPAAILSGILTALAFPKAGLSFLAWISLIPLLLVLTGKRRRSGFLTAGLAGFVFNGILLYWIPDVPAHYGGMPYWLCILIYLALILFLALYWGLFGHVFVRLHRTFPLAAFLVAPFLWIATEFILTRFLTGFPWGIVGTSQYRNLPLIQTASLAGVTGVSFLLVLVQSTFVLAVRRKPKSPFFAALALLALAHAWGGYVLKKGDFRGPTGVKAAVVQGNVSSDIYWQFTAPGEVRGIFEDHLDLTRQALDAGAELVIWPEFTVPLCWSCGEPLYKEFGAEVDRLVASSRATLVLGSNEVTGPRANPQYHNTAMAIHPDLTRSLYYKMHLVPFGEYTPYKKVFFFIERVTHAIGDITPGSDHVLHKHAAFRFGSPICYEVIFPSLVRKFVRNGADFLVTITNDGWYGKTSAPHQHWAQAVVRAVENRRYLLRAATTGVSGFVDPFGRVLASSRLMTRAVLTETVYPSARLSLYTRIGDALPVAGLTLSLFALILAVLKNAKDRNTHGPHRQII